MVKRKKFSRDFKVSVLQELNTKSMAEVCRKHDLACSTVSGWKKDYDSNPKEAFKGRGKVWKENAKIAQYERLIGRLCAELDFLKKAYETLKQESAEEKRRRRLFSK